MSVKFICYSDFFLKFSFILVRGAGGEGEEHGAAHRQEGRRAGLPLSTAQGQGTAPPRCRQVANKTGSEADR